MRGRENTYEIRLTPRLDARWAAHFHGLTFRHDRDGTTVLSGSIADQAALHGVLGRVRDLGIPLLSVTRIGRRTPNDRQSGCDLQEPGGPDA